jgi:hypothetical protein
LPIAELRPGAPSLTLPHFVGAGITISFLRVDPIAIYSHFVGEEITSTFTRLREARFGGRRKVGGHSVLQLQRSRAVILIRR